MVATTELTGSPEGALALSMRWPTRSGWPAPRPGTPTRGPVSRVGDALVGCCDAWGRIANDVATGAGREIAEFAESSGGGSSTMPHKSNPVFSVLLRRTALVAPPLGEPRCTRPRRPASTNAPTAAGTPSGPPSAPWPAAPSPRQGQADLLTGLRFDATRAAANLSAASGILARTAGDG